MSYEEELAAARARRQQQAERLRAEAQVDEEERAARKLATGEAILQMARGGMRSNSFQESRSEAPIPKRPAQAAPNSDPLELLSDEEKAMIERRPYLKKLLLADIEKAEAAGREERERAAARAEVEQAHAQNDRTHELAARIVEQRAKARGAQ